MSRKRLVSCMALLVLSAACGKDGPSGPATPAATGLTASEFNAMVDALAAANAFGFARTAALSANPLGSALVARVLASQVTQTFTIDQTHTCPGGGSARIDGSTTLNASGAQTGTINMYVHLTFTGCQATSPDGLTFTFEGNPTLNQAVTGTFAPGVVSLSAHETGDLTWTSANGKSGTCPFNLGVNTTTTTGLNTTGRATGQVCGSSIDKTF